MATMTGVIDGIGSLGAAIVQVLVGNLASCSREEGEGQGGGGGEGVGTTTTCDLLNVFNMLACGSLVGALALSRLAWREIRDAGRGR